MVALRDIQDFSQRVAEEFHPEQIILFGSHARGTAREDSDVDLLVVMPPAVASDQTAVQILVRLRPQFPVDLLVRTPERISERLAQGDSFLRDILETGKVLYAARDD